MLSDSQLLVCKLEMNQYQPGMVACPSRPIDSRDQMGGWFEPQDFIDQHQETLSLKGIGGLMS